MISLIILMGIFRQNFDYSDLVFKTSKNFPCHNFDMADSSEPVAIGFLSTALALRVELKR